MEKIWYNSYPEEVDKEVDVNQYSSLAELFETASEKYREKKAVTNLGVSLTFQELEEKTRSFGSYLQNVKDMRKGDRIAIMLPNCIQYYIALFGALRAGLVVVNVNPLYTKRELVEQLKDANVDTIVVMANFAHTLEEASKELKLKNIILTKLGDLCGFPKAQIIHFVLKYIKKIIPSYHLPSAIPFMSALKKGASYPFKAVEIEPEDVAFLQYTGGTTGIAKGAILTHYNIVANVLQTAAWTAGTLTEGEEKMVLPLPLYHIYSLTAGCMMMMALGAETVLITNPRDIPHFIKEIKNLKFTLLISINTLCNALLQHKDFKHVDFSHLKFTITGGMAVTRPVAEKWKQVTGVHLLEGYGLTETSPIVSTNSFKGTEFTGGIGYPIPGTEVEIIDEEEKPVPIGEVGELCVKGPQVMRGYWNRPEESALAFTRDGWFKTGDMATIDESGLVSVVDRKKDMVNVSGFNVFPNEVEEVLGSHPGILEAAVIGVPSEDGVTEVVKAVIVRKDPELEEQDILDFCGKHLTRYKIPHIIEFAEELPKTPVGKILRRVLKEKEQKGKVKQQKAA